MEKMTYHKEGDYLIPDMKPEPLADELRFWGEQYIKYKRKSNRAWVVCHKMNGTLLPLAIEVQKSAEEMEKKETEHLMKEYEVTTELHNNNPPVFPVVFFCKKRAPRLNLEALEKSS